MKHYVQITRYISGASLDEQLLDIAKAGLFDEDLRVFFDKHNSLNTSDIAWIARHFDMKIDFEFDETNVVFAPRSFAVKDYNKRAEKEKNSENI